MRKIQVMTAICLVSASSLAYQVLLLQAVSKGDAALVTTLIDEYGFDVDHVENGVTALDIAEKHGLHRIRELLLLRGARQRVTATPAHQ